MIQFIKSSKMRKIFTLIFSFLAFVLYSQPELTNSISLNNIQDFEFDYITLKSINPSRIEEDHSNIYKEKEFVLLEATEELQTDNLQNAYFIEDFAILYTQDIEANQRRYFIFNSEGNLNGIIDIAALGYELEHYDKVLVSPYLAGKAVIYKSSYYEDITTQTGFVVDLSTLETTPITLPGKVLEMEYSPIDNQWICYHPMTIMTDTTTIHKIDVYDEDLQVVSHYHYLNEGPVKDGYLKNNVLVPSANGIYFNPPFTSKLLRYVNNDWIGSYQAASSSTPIERYQSKYLLDANLAPDVWHYKAIGQRSFFSVLMDKASQEAFLILNSSLMSGFGEEFDFVFTAPQGVDGNGAFVSVLKLTSYEYNLYEDHAEGEDKQKILDKFNELDHENHDLALLKCKYDFDFLKRHGKEDFSSFYPRPSVDDNNQPFFDINLSPNPVKKGESLRYNIKLPNKSKSGSTNQKRIIVSLNSVTGGIIAQNEHTLSTSGELSGEFNMTYFTENIGFIVVADEEGHGGYQQFVVSPRE